jgi:hypothetical protein
VAVVPPPEVQERVIWVPVLGVAMGVVGFGGATTRVVPLTVTPVDTSGVEFPFTAQMRNEYWVAAVKPVTAWLVPPIAVNWAAEQFAGAEAPAA